ncbi:peptide ligase PGM1-related protein [Oricola sp.]|uniref:peptide ligase PGM1-related protein n=1 Tax=Oricola sp. TaxID=1979950 RepID=UPI003BAB7D20
MSSIGTAVPTAGEERQAFRMLRSRLSWQFEQVFPDPLHPRGVLIVPSLTLDTDVMARIEGVHHYEERLLCLLLLLRMPATRVVYVTSEPVAEATIDYYLHLLEGVPHRHARERLTLLTCHDASERSLTEKILERPRVKKRILEALGRTDFAHMICFNVSNLERRLAVDLGIPVYGCDPDLLPLGSKSGSRQVLREAGVAIPDGVENLTGEDDVVEALCEIKARDPDMRRAVVKLNEGFSGEGNALFDFSDAPEAGLSRWVRERLPHMAFEAAGLSWDVFHQKFVEMGGVVEAFVEGEGKRSPSAQFRIDPTGRIDPLSTHDQVLGGHTGQEYLGATFPADPAYRLEIQSQGTKVAGVLAKHGVLGRFGVDFISVPEDGGWRHVAIEINLRKGGTTHPFIMLQYLTDGAYDPQTGLFNTPQGNPRCYYATDNLCSPCYRGLCPDDLIDIAVRNGIHFHGATQTGVVFHLIGALSQFGKLGAVCVGKTPGEAEDLYRQMVAVLDRECG